MSNTIHISQARKMLDSGQRVSLVAVKKNGSLLTADDVISLHYDFYSGTRTIKFLRSGQKRLIRDCCLIRINDFEVFL
ncbi:hypothetical protein [Muribaculum intestinale]|uniref:Uncharacterized protein n=1 Tax=Muribaculum intestinale TaxID=1796646 RepID=A0A4S2G3Z8_9BACT|nr:hypothetical protein [Muribaculum intestinale]MYM13731.1 hypothetical protein [Muribaculum intestinale]TGX83782.1 hypothetical protein E5360_07570 [Muribaculum intestinale]TGY76714.1 hypothetical protein E5333_00210 [Muribaculum intestinale]